jgi:hypothetical protein
MANRYMINKLNSFNHELTYLECNFVVGSSGAVGTTKGSGVKSITRLQAGVYKISLEDGYSRYLGGFSGFVSPIGTPAAVTGVSSGVNVITSVGNTNFYTMGLDSSITPAVGVAFLVTGAGTGTGTVAPLAASGINAIEVVGDPNLTINCSNPYFIVQTLAATNSSTTTLVATDPAQYSVFGLSMMFRNSIVKGKGE